MALQPKFLSVNYDTWHTYIGYHDAYLYKNSSVSDNIWQFWRNANISSVYILHHKYLALL